MTRLPEGQPNNFQDEVDMNVVVGGEPLIRPQRERLKRRMDEEFERNLESNQQVAMKNLDALVRNTSQIS